MNVFKYIFKKMSSNIFKFLRKKKSGITIEVFMVSNELDDKNIYYYTNKSFKNL